MTSPIHSARGRAIVEVLRSCLVQLVELEKTMPEECELITALLVSDLRARRPMSIACLSVLPAPEQPIVDPRIGGAR